MNRAWEIVLHASPVVQGVLALLVLMSLASWAVIFAKWRQFARADRRDQAFLQALGDEVDAHALAALARAHEASALAQALAAGLRELAQQPVRESPQLALAAAERAMRSTIARGEETLWRRVPMLATIGATAPFVGLFGTVWGIMHTFHAIGATRKATLATVAPGIAEALIATAIGLFAAIPAVIAYNRFASWAARRENESERFIAEALNLFTRKRKEAQP